MSEFCPSCDANVGFGTVEIIGCPLCGYKPDDYDDDDLDNIDELPTDEEIEEMERQQRVWERAEMNAQRAAQRRRRKAAKTRSGGNKRCRRVPSAEKSS